MTKAILKGRALVTALHKKIAPEETGSSSRIRQALGKKLGCSAHLFYNWQTRDARVSASQIALLVEKAGKAAQRQTIKPIIEFFPIEPTNEKIDRNDKKKALKRYKLFDSSGTYKDGVLNELSHERSGVYIFYDSRGRALYVGKTNNQTLWQEMTNALNRKRDIQSIKRVRHPERHVRYKTADEKRRQIQPVNMKLHELARFVSAYEVPNHIAGVFEAILVRSFANDLLNVRMEQFVTSRRKKKK